MVVEGDRTSAPGWRLDERACAGRENLDADHVARYDAKEDADADTEVARCEGWGLTPGATVVDLGAGTGQFTLAVAPRCARVVAVDVSPVMLRRLRAKLADAGATNVDVVEAGFLTYQHVGPPADLVYSRLALHHLPDVWKAVSLARIHAVLRPGGLLRLSDVVYGFEPGEAEARFEAWCGSIAGTGADDWHRADAEEHVRDEHSTFTWLLEAMIERAGFEVEHAEYSTDRVYAHYALRAR